MGKPCPLWAMLSQGLNVLREIDEQAKASEPVSSIPTLSLHQILPPYSSLSSCLDSMMDDVCGSVSQINISSSSLCWIVVFIIAKGTHQDRNCTGEDINVIDLIMLFCWKIVEMSGVLRWKKH